MAELAKFENNDKFDLERIRSIYRDVIPEISNSGKIPPPKIREYILNFRFLSMEETINKAHTANEEN